MGLTRLAITRPLAILMTTATVVFAMLPLALKLEEGGESRAPMAVVIMGGVISSTLLTLVLVPAVYTILDDGKELVIGARRRLARRATVPAHGRATAASRVPLAPPPVRGGAED